jgi:hypothetical protein
MSVDLTTLIAVLTYKRTPKRRSYKEAPARNYGLALVPEGCETIT